MAGKANAGELRTKIKVFAPAGEALNANGYPTGAPVNVLGPDKSIYCKWVYDHGSDVYTARQLGLTEPATLTLRYTPKITSVCLIYREEDPAPYEVISLNDVEDRHTWLEVRVERKAAAQ